MSIDKPPVTPQQYEVLHGGGAAAPVAAAFPAPVDAGYLGPVRHGFDRGALYMLYPNLTGQFGGSLLVGTKSDFKPAKPLDARVNQTGVFYRQQAKAYMVHLPHDTHFLLKGTDLSDQFASETILTDTDGSYWIALYQRCVHLGCTVPYRNDCFSFKCPCHGSHYNADGEYLDGPAPRSLDRFDFHFEGENVVVDTGTLNNRVPHPDATTRLIPVPTVQCSI